MIRMAMDGVWDDGGYDDEDWDKNEDWDGDEDDDDV